MDKSFFRTIIIRIIPAPLREIMLTGIRDLGGCYFDKIPTPGACTRFIFQRMKTMQNNDYPISWRTVAFALLLSLMIIVMPAVAAPGDNPVANFSAIPTLGAAPLQVQFTDESTGDGITDRAWDFTNDGSIDSNAGSPSYTYTTAGTYSVNLTVTNASGSDSETKTGYITVLTQGQFTNPGFETGDRSGWTAGTLAGITTTWKHTGDYAVLFDMAGSNATDFLEQNVDLTDVETISFWGYGVNTNWNCYVYIDDVLVQAPNVVSNTWTRYTIPTSYTGVHKVGIKWNGNSFYGFIVDDFSMRMNGENIAPVADAQAVTTSGNVAKSITLTATDGNGDPLTYSVAVDPLHGSLTGTAPLLTYSPAADYVGTDSFTFTVNDGTVDSAPATVDITVTGAAVAPVTAFSAVPTTGDAPLPVQFNDSSSNTPDSWRWNFGDSPGSIYVADNGAYALQEIYPNGSTRSLGAGQISSPWGVAVDAQGNIYEGDYDFTFGAMKIYPNGTVVKLGTGISSSMGVAVDAQGNAYVADNTNAVVHKIYPDGTTVSWGSGYSAPTGVAVDAQGNVYVADSYLVNKIYPNGTTVSFGSGFTSPFGIAVDARGNVYVADKDAAAVYKIAPDGSSVTVGTGFTSPDAVAVDDFSGNVYVADFGSNTLFAIKPDGETVTVKSGFTLITGVAVKPADSGEQNPAHTYTAPGRYNVSLIASNAGGNNLLTQTDFITVTGLPEPITPVAGFTASTTSGVVPLFVRFNDTSSGLPDTWLWDFGDGVTNTSRNTTHTYMAEGTYSVNLTVTNTTTGTDSEVKTGLITVTVGSGGLATTAWPKSGHDLNNTGRSPYIGPQSPTINWTFTGGSYFMYSTPAIGSDGTIYIGNNDGKFYAVNPDGTQKWNYTTGKIYGSAAIARDGTIYVGSYDNNLSAINPDGSFKWSYPTGKIYGSPAIASDGTIYVGSYDKNFYAVNPDGTLKWVKATGSYFYYTTPAIGPDGTVYIGSYDKKLYAFNPDGTIRWTNTTGGGFDGGPAIGSDGTIYIGNYQDKKVYAINPDGTQKWSILTGNYIYASPAIAADGTIYIGGTDGKFYAFNPDSTQKWNVTTGGAIRGSAAVGADGTIYFGNYGNNKVYALNPDGTQKWSYTTGSYIYGSPAIGSDGTLYIGSNDKNLYAFRDPDNPPVADFTASDISGAVPMFVRFTDASTDKPFSWIWDFGDGNTSGVQNPGHLYMNEGTYTVTLNATNARGSDSEVKTGFITVNATTGDGLADSAWPKVSHDPQGTGRSEFVAPQVNTTRWIYNTGAGIGQSSPVLASDGTIYIGSGNDLNAINKGGTLKWKYTTGGSLAYNSPVISTDGTVYIGSADKKVYAINPDGSLKWNYLLSGSNTGLYGSPVILSNGLICVPTVEPNGNHWFYEFNPDGSLSSRVSVVNDVFATPVIGTDSTIYITITGSGMYGVSALYPDGVTKWTYGVPIVGYPAPYGLALGSDDTVYFGINTGNFYAVYQNGTSRWSKVIGGNFRSAPAIGADGTVYVGNTNGNLYAFNSDGTEKWTYLAGVALDYYAAPVIGSDGVIYIGSNDGTVFALNPDGTLKWKYLTSGGIQSCPAIGDDGTLYVGSGDGKLYAFNEPVSPVANFTSDVQTGIGPLNVSFTDKSTYMPTSWLWDFGDGDSTNATVQNPVHTYTSAGTYNVNLTATNVAGSNSSVNSGYITVTMAAAPVANFTSDVQNGKVPLTVTFTDQSTNIPTSWLWDFGDGDSTNATVQNPVHTYASAGTYTVNFTAINALGSNSTVKPDYITVNPGPQVTISDVTMNADGTGTATIVLDSAPTGLTAFKLNLAIMNPSVSDNLTFVTYPSGFGMYDTKGSTWPGAVFTNNVNTLAHGGFSSGYIRAVDGLGTSFPDGSTNILLATVTLHGLSEGSTTLNGTLVSLTDRTGGSLVPTTTVQNGTINVTPAAVGIPVANFMVNTTSGAAPLAVQFTDQSTGSPESWAWNFGDSTTSVEQSPVHTYTSAGTYTVSLNATNSAGSNKATRYWYITATAADGSAPLPDSRNIFVGVGNDAGVKYNLDGAAYGGENNNTYLIKFKSDTSGLNEIHITNSSGNANGQVTDNVTHTTGPSGTFWVTNTGPAGVSDDIVLLVAVNGTIPDDFSMTIHSSGYNWTPNTTIDGPPLDITRADVGIEETFTKADFRYGPQTWKPGPGASGAQPLYYGQNQADGQAYHLMFVDLRVGALNKTVFPGLIDNGAAKIEYSFNNLSARAAFDAYSWRQAANQGEGISWTNKVSGTGSNGYSTLYIPTVITPPVAAFTVSPTTGTCTAGRDIHRHLDRDRHHGLGFREQQPALADGSTTNRAQPRLYLHVRTAGVLTT